MKPHEASGIATTAVATGFVGLRVFTKIKIARDNLGFADCEQSPVRYGGIQDSFILIAYILSDLNIAAVLSAWLFAILIFPCVSIHGLLYPR